jgi:hypothetical protein
VNGQSFTLDVMKAAVRGAAENTPVVLVFKQDGVIHEAQIDYNGTLRYPHLQRIPGTRDRLSELLGPRAL